MLLITEFKDIPALDTPCGLTIGSFDGVHLGHQALLKNLKAKLPANGLLVVFTFSNHPTHYFAPHAPIPLICPPLQKVKLLKEYGADIVILTPFTSEFSKISFDQFLHQLMQKLSFSHLLLGTGATFGRNKEGNEANVRHLSLSMGFEVEYLPKLTLHGTPVSSGRIRTLITHAAFHDIQACMGRPYSLLCHLNPEKKLHEVNVEGLCLPPEGIYPVRIKTSSHTHLARAHITPQAHQIQIELLHSNEAILEKEAEVIFG